MFQLEADDPRLLVELVDSERRRLLDSGGMTEADFESGLEECERMARDPDRIVVSFLVTQVWGRKRKLGFR